MFLLVPACRKIHYFTLADNKRFYHVLNDFYFISVLLHLHILLSPDDAWWQVSYHSHMKSQTQFFFFSFFLSEYVNEDC